MSGYSRDLLGYGATPPQANWPGDARIAVQFVLNCEEGGENNILHGDAASEAFLSEVIGAQPWPGQRHMSVESIYEYGARAGFWRIHRLFTGRKIPLTVFGVAQSLARTPEAVAAMKAADWEIASHGLKWIDYKDFSAEAEAAHIRQAIGMHRDVTGSRPLGFYQGRTSQNTNALVMREGGFLYTADSYADELPYWTYGDGGPLLAVPYTLDANDMRFATAQGFNSGDQFFSYLKDSFDVLYAEGAERPAMMSVGLHSRIAGRPGRAAALARFLDYVQSHERVWLARRIDIARHWIAHHPPEGGYVPSRMPRALFVEVFGSVFEHTPSIAEHAHAAGLDESLDNADGLHAALVTMMRNMSMTEKFALIHAHPDLAGKLAVSGQLTRESAREQNSAGLDRLSAAEFHQFTAMNETYKAKFSMPFIIAVKGLTKADIWQAFEQRVANSAATEINEALVQIEKIALLRLKDRLPA